jgi:lipid-binding SYLF domain-containing protein
MQKFCCWLLLAVLCPFVFAQTKPASKDKSKNPSKSQSTPTPTPTPSPSQATSLVPEEQRRLEEAGTVLKEILNMPDYIPQSLLNKAECILVFPQVKKFAFGIGGSSGHGALSCRTGDRFRGPWSPPAIYSLKAGSIGLQVGGQTTDFVLLIMNPRGVDSVLRNKIKLGSDAAIAAGPRGKLSSASSDASMHAEILAYPRSRSGFFAGVSLEGATLGQDNNANQKIYGRKVTATEIVRQQAVQVTVAGNLMISTLNKLSPSNLANPEPGQ